jgi:hypothetical protein
METLPPPLHIKILGLKSRQRYLVRRVIQAALSELQKEFPHLQLHIKEFSDLETIQRYTPVLIAPALVINEELVYDLWIPAKEQVTAWLRERIAQ